MTLGDLVERDGLHYEKFTDIPFTGEMTGNPQGSYKNGKKDGAWVYYYPNGQVYYKGNYKNNKREGKWVYYYPNGQVHYKGNYKNNKKEGAHIGWYQDRTVNK